MEVLATALVYEDRATGTSRRVDVDGVFVQIGPLPNTEWPDGRGHAAVA